MRNLIFLVAVFFSTTTFAEVNNIDVVKKNIQNTLPGLPIDSIKSTPIKGIYELISAGSLVYITEDAQHYLSGQLIDVVNKINLTNRAQNSIRLQTLSSITLDEMLIYPAKGEKKHHITVFTDTSCPFCTKLHEELPELVENGVEVRYLLYPRAGVGSGAYNTMVNVWCADDKQQALTDAKEGKALDFKDCETPILKHLALGRKMGLEGTPMIILDDGTLISGYRPAKALIEQLK